MFNLIKAQTLKYLYKAKSHRMVTFFKNGGPEVIRTPDLLGANEALYQLSYVPLELSIYNSNKFPQIIHEKIIS